MSSLALFANYVACFNLLYLQLINTFEYPTSHTFLLRLHPLGPNVVPVSTQRRTAWRDRLTKPLLPHIGYGIEFKAARTIRRLSPVARPNRLSTSYLGPFGFQYPAGVPIIDGPVLDAGVSTINHKLAPGHEARLLGKQEFHAICDIFWMPQPPDRMLQQEHFLERLLILYLI